MLDQQHQQFEPKLVVERKTKLRQISQPGMFWLLIVLALFISGLAVSILDERDINVPSVDSTEHLRPNITTERNPRVYSVSYKSGVFSPTNLRIRAGDTVRFKNEGLLPIRIASDPESEYSQIAGFDSIGDIPQGSYFSFTFAAQGVFGYYNINTSNGKGTIIVR